jgi:hypothetical protein
MNVKNKLLQMTKYHQYLPKWSIWLGIAICTAIAIYLAKDLDVFAALEAAIAKTENRYQQWGDRQSLTNSWLLLAFAFGGGLLDAASQS